MATSPYFNNYPGTITSEQLLFEDLVIESIQVYGSDVYYLPRNTLSEMDNLYGEDPAKYFDAAYGLEAYVGSIMGFEGQSEFFTKFGLEIRDPMKIIIARRTFNRYVPGLKRPREGDLVWMPQLTNMFEITAVEEEKDFYSLGRRPPFYYFYQINIELYKFSNERFRTGIRDIDQFGSDYSYTIHLNMNPSGAGAYTVGEVVYQGPNTNYATASAIVKSWDRTSKTLDVINIKGSITANTILTGNTSSASYAVTSYDRQDFSHVLEEFVDNTQIQSEANSILDYSESNPFGSP